MQGQQTRASLAVLALLALWVVVYWWTPPRESPVASAGFDRDIIGPGARPAPQPSGTPAPKLTPPPSDPTPVVPPTFQRHTVQSGDTAESISLRVFGTRRHWQSIVQSNPLVDFAHLKRGSEILVPLDPNNVQGMPAADVKPSVGEPGVPPESADGTREIIVRSGETLSSIAKREYGKSSLWPRILQANQDQLNDEGTNLKPGMALKIPPKP